MGNLVNAAQMTVSTSSGVGTLTLGSATPSYLSFSDAGCVDGERYSYVLRDGTNREWGEGTYSSAGTFTRDTVFGSTNANAKINATTSAIVSITALASDIGASASADTVSAFQARSFSADVSSVNILGYHSIGVGALQVRRVASEPTHPWKFRSTDRYLPDGSTDNANGGWWEGIAQNGSVNVLSFGAKADGVTNDTDAFYAASTIINDADGGELIVPPGTYKVGKQLYHVDGLNLQGAPIISIANCTGSVRIVGVGAKLVADPLLKYGAFDYNTGQPVYPPMPNYDYDTACNIYRGMIKCQSNSNVYIEGFELDGNSENIILGGQFGDSGWQLEGHGVWLYANQLAHIKNVYTHDHCADGLVCVNPGMTEASPARPHLFENVVFKRNGRLGMAITGGKGISAINCDFSDTGTVLNIGANQVIDSTPGSGVDIEAESSVVRDVTFTNTRFMGNYRGGLIAASGDSRRVHFVNCIFDRAVVAKPQYAFTDCIFLGFTDLVLQEVDPYTGITNTPGDGYVFDNCLFSYDATLTETGVLVDDSPSTWNYNVYSVFQNCTIDTGSYLLPNTFSYYSLDKQIRWIDCNFISSHTAADSAIEGIFRGTSNFTLSRPNIFGFDSGSSRLEYGTIVVNGDTVKTVSPISSANVKTSDYTLQPSDQAGKLVTFNSGSAVNCFIQYNPTVSLSLLTPISIANLGTGTLTIAPSLGSGVVINGVTSLSQYQSAQVIQLSTNVWLSVMGI